MPIIRINYVQSSDQRFNKKNREIGSASVYECKQSEYTGRYLKRIKIVRSIDKLLGKVRIGTEIKKTTIREFSQTGGSSIIYFEIWALLWCVDFL